MNIVKKAEESIKALGKPNIKNPDVLELNIKANQIRKILSTVNILKNKVDIYKINNLQASTLSDELSMEVEFLRVNIAYQAGRDKTVKEFVEKTDLLNMIKKINGNIKAFEEFCKYVEALVAFHKYYGGKD